VLGFVLKPSDDSNRPKNDSWSDDTPTLAAAWAGGAGFTVYRDASVTGADACFSLVFKLL
jgi:hypothetical protein